MEVRIVFVLLVNGGGNFRVHKGEIGYVSMTIRCTFVGCFLEEHGRCRIPGNIFLFVSFYTSIERIVLCSTEEIIVL